jgi:uncharacterized SAM-binding protein YcdF (DUF218 family)
MNFLFLSKLLPLFLYPLGLSCLLLLLALILSWKKPKLVPFPMALALILLLVASNSAVSEALMGSLEGRIPPLKEAPTADAIVILGGATKSAIKPRTMVDVNEHGDRLFYGAQLYKEEKAPLIILAGGRFDWYGKSNPESTDMAELLQILGVPPSAMIEDPLSLNTYQNALNVQKILEHKGINRILLVTSAFHMYRALLIFQKLGIEAIAAPTDFFVVQPDTTIVKPTIEGFILDLLPDAHRLSMTTLAIKEYIGIEIYRLKGWL